ncbi:MAG: two-component sensor histidine kinase [Clostridia bacterium]|nr:two-component sensor histidine kinase [Clostridia bacterium]
MKKEKRLTPGLRTKLIAITALFTALILAVIWLLFVVFLDDFYRQTKRSELMSTAKDVEARITLDSQSLADYIADVCRDTGANILVQRRTGAATENIGFVNPRGILANTFAVSALIENTRREGGTITYTFDGSSGSRGDENDSMLYSHLTEQSDGYAAVMIYVQLTPVDATRTTIIGLLLIVSVVFILIAVIIGQIMASTLSAPLTKLNENAKHIGTPAYERLTGGAGCRETAELDETLSKASAELQKVDDLRRELISNVSHDLRTPLTMISGYGEMMRDIPGENNAENIQIIIDEADHLNRLVNDMLSLSKLEAGMDHLDITEFNVTEKLSALVGRYASMRAVQGYTLDFKAEREYVIKGDELKLTQVFYNLINNAINYTGPSKLVRIIQSEVTERGARYLRFDVIDDGDGILPENLPYIWDRYFKENRAHRRADVGTGLGLCIVKRIMEAHGGGYGVNSEPGKGSDFFVTLPLKAEGFQFS